MKLMLLSVALFSAASAVLLYHPFFRIEENRVRPRGLARINRAEFTDAVGGILRSRRWGILPGNSFLSVNLDEVRDIVRNRFSMRSVEVRKNFPHFLDIVISENAPRLIYDDGERYSAVGMSGEILELLRPVPETEWSLSIAKGEDNLSSSAPEAILVHEPPAAALRAEYGDYPIIYDRRPRRAIAVGSSVLSPTESGGIEKWHRFLEGELGLKVKYAALENDRGDLAFYPANEWKVLARAGSDSDVEEGIVALRAVWRTIPKERSIDYIDVRYPGKVYWQ